MKARISVCALEGWLALFQGGQKQGGRTYGADKGKVGWVKEQDHPLALVLLQSDRLEEAVDDDGCLCRAGGEPSDNFLRGERMAYLEAWCRALNECLGHGR